MCGFIEDENGNQLDGHILTEIRAYARQIWFSLAIAGIAPLQWSKASIETSKYYYRELRAKYKAFRYCANNWKAKKLATVYYSDWCSRHHPTTKRAREEERTVNDVDLQVGPSAKRQCTNSNPGSQRQTPTPDATALTPRTPPISSRARPRRQLRNPLDNVFSVEPTSRENTEPGGIGNTAAASNLPPVALIASAPMPPMAMDTNTLINLAGGVESQEHSSVPQSSLQAAIQRPSDPPTRCEGWDPSLRFCKLYPSLPRVLSINSDEQFHTRWQPRYRKHRIDANCLDPFHAWYPRPRVRHHNPSNCRQQTNTSGSSSMCALYSLSHDVSSYSLTLLLQLPALRTPRQCNRWIRLHQCMSSSISIVVYYSV